MSTAKVGTALTRVPLESGSDPTVMGKNLLFTFPREGLSRRNIFYRVLYSSWARGNKLSYSGMPHREPPFHFRALRLRLMRTKPIDVSLQGQNLRPDFKAPEKPNHHTHPRMPTHTIMVSSLCLGKTKVF